MERNATMRKAGLILTGMVVMSLQGAMAQKWEIGAAGGGSFYTSNDVTRGNASAQAGFAPGFAAGFLLSQDMGRYWGGDLRYTYLYNEAELKSGGAKASFGAQSHAIHYDFLLHLRPSGDKTRPYIAFGAGIKHHRGTGKEAVVQNLSEFALLTRSTDTTPLASFGFGVKFRVGESSSVRVEIRDYLSPVPTKIIAPNRGASLSGWTHNLVPMVAVSYVF
jgi:hypothetical protein